jgi:hypothetical protein
MAKTVVLNQVEIHELDAQDPLSASDGGYQSFLVHLQQSLDRQTGRLLLNDEDLLKIPRYAYDYRQGGWQTRLERIFRRTLGPNLQRT